MEKYKELSVDMRNRIRLIKHMGNVTLEKISAFREESFNLCLDVLKEFGLEGRVCNKNDPSVIGGMIIQRNRDPDFASFCKRPYRIIFVPEDEGNDTINTKENSELPFSEYIQFIADNFVGVEGE